MYIIIDTQQCLPRDLWLWHKYHKHLELHKELLILINALEPRNPIRRSTLGRRTCHRENHFSEKDDSNNARPAYWDTCKATCQWNMLGFIALPEALDCLSNSSFKRTKRFPIKNRSLEAPFWPHYLFPRHQLFPIVYSYTLDSWWWRAVSSPGFDKEVSLASPTYTQGLLE